LDLCANPPFVLFFGYEARTLGGFGTDVPPDGVRSHAQHAVDRESGCAPPKRPEQISPPGHRDRREGGVRFGESGDDRRGGFGCGRGADRRGPFGGRRDRDRQADEEPDDKFSRAFGIKKRESREDEGGGETSFGGERHGDSARSVQGVPKPM
jgi:hypothetical protein